MSHLRDYVIPLPFIAIIDVAVFIRSFTQHGETMLTYIVTKAFKTPVDFIGSECHALIPALGAVVFSVLKNDTEIGSISFSAGSITGVFTSPSATMFVDGDLLKLVNQVTADVNLAGISISIRGDL